MLDIPHLSELLLGVSGEDRPAGHDSSARYFPARLVRSGAFKAMLKSLPIILAVVAVFFTLAFPTPQDALKIARIVPPEPQHLPVDGLDTGPNFVTLAANTPMEPMVSRIEATGCLDLLPNLPADLVETCSAMIADAVIQIAIYEGDASYDLTQQNALLVERLRLAAAKVCRSRWVSDPDIDFDLNDPVCEVSTINLASLE